MLRNLGLVFATLALFMIAGGQWTALQTVAWAKMLHDYTQRTGSVVVAVEQTFDGQHPCELCREIASAKAKEHKESPVTPRAKDDTKAKALVADSLLSLIVAVSEARLPRAASDLGSGRPEAPPTPPPRGAAVAA